MFNPPNRPSQSIPSSSRDPVQHRQDDPNETDEEWEEETTYALLDLGRKTSPAVLRAALQNDPTYQIIGLDSPTPFLRLGSLFFRGKHERTLGTDLVVGPPGWDGDRSGQAPHQSRANSWGTVGAGVRTATVGAVGGSSAASGGGGLGLNDTRYQVIAATRKRVHMERVSIVRKTSLNSDDSVAVASVNADGVTGEGEEGRSVPHEEATADTEEASGMEDAVQS
ncbi:hypothetical protein HDU93_003568 [Gonapodya sp. JEL0774]|nr:hypothetical protein HDU93_003568 [Gonapodya sp. JEL0774]